MITLTNITYSYKGRKNVTVLDDISFTIGQDEKHAIVGVNGAGKSTLIKLLIGILSPSTGTIRINNLDPWSDRLKYVKNIGVVWGQRSTLWWDIPVKDSYAALKTIYNIPSATFNKQLSFGESIFSLREFSDRPLRTLSLGQRVRADIVAALLHNPSLLFLDEPFIGLDFMARRAIIGGLKQIAREKPFTLILTSHNLQDIEELANNITVLQKGKIRYRGPLNKLPVKPVEQTHLIVRKDADTPITIDPAVAKEAALTIQTSTESGRYDVYFNQGHQWTERIVSDILKKNHILGLEFATPSLEEQLSALLRNEGEVNK